MTRCVFIGEILPPPSTVVGDNWSFVITLPNVGPHGLTLSGTTTMQYSQVVIPVQCTTREALAPRLNANQLEQVKDHVQRMAQFQVAAYGLVYGQGLDVVITAEVEYSHPPLIFNGVIPGLALPAAERQQSLAEYWELVGIEPNERSAVGMASRFLRLALINYMRAMREPQEAFMFCYRAIEAIHHYEDFVVLNTKGQHDKKREWKALRKLLQIPNEQYLTDLEKRARACRHGDLCIPSSREEYLAALRTARAVITRFARYMHDKRQGTSLKDDELPALSDSEFNTSPASIAMPPETATRSVTEGDCSPSPNFRNDTWPSL
ncbi:MAG: hypothetical protein M1294_13925 [Firmicutes bacterium]|nr:hypothetical protein [Bacillota bacterium]MCL5012828.1 hypothetical protein [Bacillota bacterium]